MRKNPAYVLRRFARKRWLVSLVWVGWVAVGLVPCAIAGSAADWASYLGGSDRNHYSELTQINRGNVKKLVKAWEYRSGEKLPNALAKIECNPLVIDGVMYASTSLVNVVAVNAATGEEIWRFEPTQILRNAGVTERFTQGVSRGVSYWAAGDNRRILATYGPYLFALDCRTGKPIESFGDGGRVDFRNGLGRDLKGVSVTATTPVTVFENLCMLPIRCTEGPGPSAPGYVRAYDVLSGKLVWTFRTIPSPGDYGYETWPPDVWQYVGGANCWAGMAVDEQRGLLFVPTGSPTYDFWGGNRAGENLFSNTLLCLDARTGERRWHYQIVRHDLWDRDLPAPPNLVTLRRNDEEIPAVAQITKTGHVFVFHRETGVPLFPIDDVPVPSSDLLGEVAWPTQPIPRKPKPFSRQQVTIDDLTVRTPESHRVALEQFSRMKQNLPFQPPSLQPSVMIPGRDGGAEWGGAAADPEGVLYVNGSELAWVNPMIEARSKKRGVHPGANTYKMYCAACHQEDRSGNAAQGIPSLASIGARVPVDEIFQRITEGKGMMPSFAFLGSEVRRSLADFLASPDKLPQAMDERSDDVAIGAQGYYNVPFVSGGEGRWLDKDGFPNITPPWGTLNAIDLNTGEYRWRIPLGEFPGFNTKDGKPSGTDNYGGPVVTAGGLIFIAATQDHKIRAFDRATGEILWEEVLPAGGYATPSTYLANGKQYVVIACGGGRLGSPASDRYVAYALPDTAR